VLGIGTLQNAGMNERKTGEDRGGREERERKGRKERKGRC